MKALWALVAFLAAVGPASAQTWWPSERAPRPLPARDVAFPPYHLRTLPNGLQVVAVQHHEQPVVSMRMLVRAGAIRDPRDKLGLAQLAAALLPRGTTRQSATELNEEVDFIGGAMGAGAGSDLTFINMIVMKDSFDRGLSLMSDMARRPAFAPAEIDRQRQQTLSSLQVSFEDPGFLADAVFGRLVYGFHPYGLPQSGTPETTASISRADLLAYHRQYFVPNNTIVAVVGDVTPEEAFAGVERAFGDWARADVPTQTLPPPPDPTRRIVVVNKPDAVQTEVRVGHLGVRRNHDDYLALNLATRLLGGEGANRLQQVLRTERGLTYGAQADMHALQGSGDFEASTNTRTDATAEVLRLIIDEFWRLQRERVGEQELADAKAYITGSFPLTIETPDVIATQVLNALFYGLPVEQLQTFRERVNAVTADDIQRVARFYFRPDRLSVVLVGDARAFAPALQAAGFGGFETVEAGDLDLGATDFKRAGGPGRADGPNGAGRSGRAGRAGRAGRSGRAGESGRAGRSGRAGESGRVKGVVAGLQAGGWTAYLRESTQPGARAEALVLLDEVIAAKGGLETLRSVRGLKAMTLAGLTTPDGVIEAETTTYLEYPNRVRVETMLPDGLLVQVYDGTQAWVRDPSGTHAVPEDAVRELQASLRRDTLAALLAAHDGRLRARLLPDVRGPAGATERAIEISGTDLDPVVLYVDPETRLVARQTHAAGRGQPLVEERFSDYRDIDGVRIAFSAEVYRGGRQVLERRVIEIAINPPFAPLLFQRPAS